MKCPLPRVISTQCVNFLFIINIDSVITMYFAINWSLEFWEFFFWNMEFWEFINFSCQVYYFLLCRISNFRCFFAKLFIWADMGLGKWSTKAHINRSHWTSKRWGAMVLSTVAALVNWVINNSVHCFQALQLAINILICFLLVTINKLNVGILNRIRSNPHLRICFSGWIIQQLLNSIK